MEPIITYRQKSSWIGNDLYIYHLIIVLYLCNRYMKHERFLENKMKRDAIDFEKDKVSTLFRKLLIPTLLGTISISAVTAIDGIFVGHGVGADGVQR